MAITDFDGMVDIVEDNITLGKNVISGMVSQSLGLTERKAGELFQNIDPEGRTLKQYILDRKNLRALGEIASGTTKEAACEHYGVDPSNHHRFMKSRFLRKSIADLRKEGFSCPGPVYLAEILEREEIHLKTEYLSKDNEQMYIAEIQRLIDENSELKKSLETQRKKAGRQTTGSNDSTEITGDSYNRFLEIEEMRIIYGFTVSEMLWLYRCSLKSRFTLAELCDRAQDAYLFEWEKNKQEVSNHYNPDEEMDSGEVWDYYFGDDDPADLPDDPYARTDEDRYIDRMLFEEEYQENEEYFDEDITEEEERQINEIEKEWQTKSNRSDVRKPMENKADELNDEDIPF